MFGFGLIKKVLLVFEINSFDVQLDLECDYQCLVGCSDDYCEGVSVFLVKWLLQFSGKQMMMIFLVIVVVIGSGIMGVGIVEVVVVVGYLVCIFDINFKVVDLVIEGIVGCLVLCVVWGKLVLEQVDVLLVCLYLVYDLVVFVDVDLVIEVVFEWLEVKMVLFVQLVVICVLLMLLISNILFILIIVIVVGVKNLEWVVGLYFFNLVLVMKLVEVVSGFVIFIEVVEQLCQCVSGWGKQLVCCCLMFGFIVNCVVCLFYVEVWCVLEEQVVVLEIIDVVLCDGGGFLMGLLVLMDLIGQDVNFVVICLVFNVFWQDCCYLLLFFQ